MLIPYFRIDTIAEKIGYDKKHFRDAIRWIPKRDRFTYNQLQHLCIDAESELPLENTKYASYDGIVCFLCRTRRYKMKAGVMLNLVHEMNAMIEDLDFIMRRLQGEHRMKMQDDIIAQNRAILEQLQAQLDAIIAARIAQLNELDSQSFAMLVAGRG
jgi:hypothetical protein